MRNRWGQCITRVALRDQEVQVRVLTFVEGTPVGYLENKSQIDYQQIGEFVGQMNRQLASFQHPGLEGRAETDEWCMWQMSQVVDKHSQHVKCSSLRKIIVDIKADFAEQVDSQEWTQ